MVAEPGCRTMIERELLGRINVCTKRALILGIWWAKPLGGCGRASPLARIFNPG